MYLKTSLIVLALLGGMGAAFAAPTAPDESAKTIDLTAAGKGIYYLFCHAGKKTDLTTCTAPRLYEETNGLKGLQTSPVFIGRWIPADSPVKA